AEHLTLITGTLVCRLGPHTVTLAPGDSLAFQADVPHAFSNPGSDPCAYFLVIDSRPSLVR
ncbi:MAG: cupin domain-containing protein, partial [Chloroflexota bacterium]|nr:cupin domain-containing protein [Chloroflexota bacterium]